MALELVSTSHFIDTEKSKIITLQRVLKTKSNQNQK